MFKKSSKEMKDSGTHIYGKPPKAPTPKEHPKKITEVYIIMSPSGGIGLSFSGEGTVYSDLDEARKALKRKNEWSKTKGYGVYELVKLKVIG